ncbi:Sodium/potassium-transporting ATPase subunit beta-2 [Cryptotermes secundus]|uniref:Sodium/potassium-transporting ATPase subunit beta-2 n=1 Tax=Cryptotermes secundus TaxID=105785 RepID=A0A2J7RL67_9NEOP|nr:sodium/potassium-transporting ATPase subunit beta-2 isoform X2 [Cryptotermes secundus]PNF41573.1 Sodium/potassium-transporting ATPase subunit beta-2 [Cryptotermes secundus]
MALNQKPVEYQFYLRPPTLGKWEAFKLFLYNSSTGEVFGRTGPSWAKIGLFYLIFFGVLASLFAVCLWVFFQTLDPRIPTCKLSGSLIGTSPGLGFRPSPPVENVESTLIWYKGTALKQYQHWTNSLEKFLEVYRKPGLTPGRGQNIYNCDYDRPPNENQVCDVDVKDWFPCTQENHFNYHKSAPCIFIKLNKIYDWRPEFYNDTNDLPHKMPRDLKEHIIAQKNINPQLLNTIWVSCEGESPADVENIGPIKYIPKRGFPGYFYPYKNSEGYLSPVMAIHFERPRTGILINIECKAWARNIIHNRQERVGMVHFELMID